MRIATITTVAALALGTPFANGAIIVDFSLSEQLAGVYNPGPFTATDALDPDISSPTAQAVGTFAEGGGGTAAGELNWVAWSTNTEFLTVELTVAAGQMVTLSDITLDISRNGSGAPNNFYAVVLPGTGHTGAVLGAATHLDVQTVPISGGAGGSVGQTQSWDLSSVADMTGSFTIGIGPETGAGGNMRFSEIVVNGTVVPEPSTFALAALGLLGLLACGRRRTR